MATETQLRPLLRPWLAALRQRSEATARGYDVAVTRFLHGVATASLTRTRSRTTSKASPTAA
jgi:hypothetical protein